MQEFNNYSDIAKHFNVKEYEVEKAHAEQGWRGKFFINNNEIKIETYENNLKYVFIDETNNKDCKEYLLKYDAPKYNWKVYVDELDGWQNCEVIDIKNKGLDITSATVKTDSGIKLKRFVEYAMDEEDLVPNRCVFMVEKEQREINKEYDENEFYTIRGKTLLATSHRGGYFLNPETNTVENIVYKDSGCGNCIMGSLDYMKRLIKSSKINGIDLGYEYTDEGRRLLGLDKEKVNSKKSIDDIISNAEKKASIKNSNLNNGEHIKER